MPGLGLATPQFDNPLQQLGFALQSYAAGVRGDELPIQRFQREQRAAEQEQRRAAADQLLIMSQARDVLQGIPVEQRAPVVEQLGQLLGEDAMPMLEAVMAAGGNEIENEDFREALEMAGGDRKLAGRLIGQSSFRKGLQEARDTRQLGSVRAKAESIIKSLGEGIPEGPSGLPAVSLDTLLTFSNALPDKDAMRLSEQEIPTLRRQWGALASEMGLESPEIREFAQKEGIKTKNRLAVKGAGTSAGAPAEKPTFGASMQGRALSDLLKYKEALDAGMMSPEIENRARVAAHVLQQKKFLRTPEGDLAEYPAFGVPEGFPIPGAARSPEASANATAEQLGTGQKLVKAKLPEKDNQRVTMAMQAIDDAATLLDAANRSGETITGVVGQAKALGGGLARQAGVPVGDSSRQLQAKLEEVKALAAPAVLGEGGRTLSDADRKRLDKLVGSLDFTMDDVALRGALSEVLKLLEKANVAGGSARAETSGEQIAVNPQTGERLVLRGGKWVPLNGK